MNTAEEMRAEIADCNATQWSDDQWDAIQWAEALPGLELQKSPMLSAMGIDHWVIRAAGETRGSDSITVARGATNRPLDFIAASRRSDAVRALAAAFALKVGA